MSFILDHLSYTYQPGTVYEVPALKDISLKIDDGEFIGLIGHTGSGKSTLVQHLNGLLKGTSGTIYYNGQDIYDKDYSLHDLRMEVGMVFQYPENQLFEETVMKDVMFGPKNQGLDEKEQTLRAYDALKKVHFPDDSFDQKEGSFPGRFLRPVPLRPVGRRAAAGRHRRGSCHEAQHPDSGRAHGRPRPSGAG